ncbi:MAG: hypothetical protein WKF94_03710 [Solirubrobacteraceae bacterium]
MPATLSTVSTYQVTIALTPPSGVSNDELEEFTIALEEVMCEHGYGEHFGASASCAFDPASVEIDLLIPAVSASIVNRRVSEVMAEVEKHLPVQTLHDQQIVAQPVTAA